MFLYLQQDNRAQALQLLRENYGSYDLDQALVLAQLRNFREGLLFIYEKKALYACDTAYVVAPLFVLHGFELLLLFVCLLCTRVCDSLTAVNCKVPRDCAILHGQRRLPERHCKVQRLQVRYYYPFFFFALLSIHSSVALSCEFNALVANNMKRPQGPVAVGAGPIVLCRPRGRTGSMREFSVRSRTRCYFFVCVCRFFL